MNHFFSAAKFTLNLTTPVEGAVAPFHHKNSLSSVATATAHEVAAVDADAGVVASTTVRARNAKSRVLFAEARRWF